MDVIVPLPFSIDYETAAAVSIAYGTSYLALEKMAKDREGLVLLHIFFTKLPNRIRVVCNFQRITKKG